MKQIGLLSDTHGYLDPAVFTHFSHCDEIWHCGDFGSLSLARQLTGFKPVRGVFGNIDGADIRSEFGETARFTCEGVKVLMIHIGGYPGKYTALAQSEIRLFQPGLFITGHSHILKIMHDPRMNCLHINPGAAGRQGWHKQRTLVRFRIDGTDIRNCEVIELGAR